MAQQQNFNQIHKKLKMLHFEGLISPSSLIVEVKIFFLSNYNMKSGYFISGQLYELVEYFCDFSNIISSTKTWKLIHQNYLASWRLEYFFSFCEENVRYPNARHIPLLQLKNLEMKSNFMPQKVNTSKNEFKFGNYSFSTKSEKKIVT